MPLRVTEIRLPLGGDESTVPSRALRRAGVQPDEVASIELVRKSFDRRRGRREIVYTIDLHLKDASMRHGRRRDRRVRHVDPPTIESPRPGSEDPVHPPIVIGAGPAGLFAALVLARNGYRPRIVERGPRMNHRVRDVEAFHRRHVLSLESNYLFGEGGAGTFSDGKLTSRGKDPRTRLVLDEFRRLSGMEVVRYWYRPHLGSERVRAVVGRIRREIEDLGGRFFYRTRVDRIVSNLGRVVGVETSEGELAARIIVCAPGHSARDFYESLLHCGVRLQQKPFQMGFRVEHRQDFIDSWVYGVDDLGARYGPADYRLSTRVEGASVFSFCMCPGGQIIPAVHDDRHFNTNGMSSFHRGTGFANSGIVTTVLPERFGDAHPLAGVRLQEHHESIAANLAGDSYRLPAQRIKDFMNRSISIDLPPTSCRTGTISADVEKLVPRWVADLVRRALGIFDRQIPGFIREDAVICGPEARSSSPVRLERETDTMMSPGLDGLYPVGEGSGYAGGIVSAAVDGWRAAEAIIGRFATPKGTGS